LQEYEQKRVLLVFSEAITPFNFLSQMIMVNKHLTVKRSPWLSFRDPVKTPGISREQPCSLTLGEKHGETGHAASLLEMLTLCAIFGTRLNVTAKSRNESKALAVLEEIFENGAGN
jgi:phosphotransferase system HPr-like phosphotransfer protein